MVTNGENYSFIVFILYFQFFLIISLGPALSKLNYGIQSRKLRHIAKKQKVLVISRYTE
jgi:hypothetical protein